MISIGTLRDLCRYNVLTPVASLFALAVLAGGATAEDKVVAAGTTDSDSVSLNAGDSLTNAGTITNAPGFSAVYFDPGPGTITFILNEEGAVISSTGPSAVGILGDLDAFTNHGTISADTGLGLAVQNDVGTFVNTGTMTSGDYTFGTLGNVGSFVNEGTMTSTNVDAFGAGGNVGSIRNTGTMTGGSDGIEVSGNVGSVLNTGTMTGGTDGIEIHGNVGSVRNTGTMTGGGDGIEINGNVESFVNSGKIVGVSGRGFFGTGSLVGSFINSGEILADDPGVEINAFTTFTNSGTIHSEGAPGVFVPNDSGEFTNSGEISSATSHGVVFFGALDSFNNAAGGKITADESGAWFTKPVGSFVNAGEIVGGTRGVEFEGTVTTFENSGRIESFENGVTFKGGFVSALNSGVIISTAPSGQIGVRIEEPGGTFINSGTITGSDAGVAYVLNTAGDNTFINSGTIRGNFDAISFRDGADGGDDTLIIKTGSKLYGRLRFGTGDDTFDFSGFHDSALLRVHGLGGETLIPGNNLYYFDEPRQLLGIVDPTGPLAAANVIGDIAGQISNVIPSQFNVTPTGNTILGYAPMPVESEAERAMAVFDPAPPASKIWGTVLGGGSQDDSPDLAHVFGGIVAGGHTQLAPGTTLGLLGGYVADWLEAGANYDIESGTGVVGVYGSHTAGTVEVDFSVLAGWSGHSSTRDFVALGADETATADYSSWFLAPSLGAAVPVLAMDNGEVRVAARAGYIGGNVEGYAETGSSMNLTVGDQSISRLDARIGVESEFAVGSLENPAHLLLEAGLFGQTNLGDDSVPISFLGQTQNVSPGDSHIGVYGGFDIAASVADAAEVFAGADASLRDDGMISGVAKAGLSGSF